MRRDLRQHGAPGARDANAVSGRNSRVATSPCVHARPVISLVCNLPHPCNLAVFRHRAGHHPYDMLRSLLLLWTACTGRVSATWVCGGNVEITESWDGTKRINGHCEGKPNLPSPRA